MGGAAHGVANSWTQLSDFTFTFNFHALEKEMASHFSAWRIPGMGEPGRLPAVCGVAQSRTRLKQLSSSSSKPFYRAWLELESQMPTGVDENVGKLKT